MDILVRHPRGQPCQSFDHANPRDGVPDRLGRLSKAILSQRQEEPPTYVEAASYRTASEGLDPCIFCTPPGMETPIHSRNTQPDEEIRRRPSFSAEAQGLVGAQTGSSSQVWIPMSTIRSPRASSPSMSLDRLDGGDGRGVGLTDRFVPLAEHAQLSRTCPSIRFLATLDATSSRPSRARLVSRRFCMFAPASRKRKRSLPPVAQLHEETIAVQSLSALLAPVER